MLSILFLSHTDRIVVRSRNHMFTTKPRGRAAKLRIGLWLVGGVLGLALLIFTIWIFGHVRGEEFSPQRFAIRQFRYVQIPLLRIQVWPVSTSKVSSVDDALANHVRRTTRQNGLMNQVRNSPVRWDIVTLQETGRQYRGDASILTNYLRQPTGASGMESWLDWSKANPKLAGELWGIVAQLANEDLYPIIPEVLEEARRLDASNFATQLRMIVAKECQAFTNAYTTAGEVKRAQALTKFLKRVQSPQFTTEMVLPKSAKNSSGEAEVVAESADVSKEDL